MTELTLRFDSSCNTCMEALDTLKTEEATNRKGYYGASKNGVLVTPFLLRPDRNSCGTVTHWHLEKPEEQK